MPFVSQKERAEGRAEENEKEFGGNVREGTSKRVEVCGGCGQWWTMSEECGEGSGEGNRYRFLSPDISCSLATLCLN